MSRRFLKSNIRKTARLKDKVTIAQEESIPNIWNGQDRSQDCQNEEADRSSAPLPPLPLEVGPLNPARRSGAEPSQNQFWCILALRSGILW